MVICPCLQSQATADGEISRLCIDLRFTRKQIESGRNCRSSSDIGCGAAKTDESLQMVHQRKKGPASVKDVGP